MAVKTTEYGFIGVGRMGAHMARRLLKAGISLTVYDTSKEAVAQLEKDGAQVASSSVASFEVSYTVKLIPAFNKRRAMCAPMRPTPMNP